MRSRIADYCPCRMCTYVREQEKNIPDDTVHRDSMSPKKREAVAEYAGGIRRRAFILLNGAED